MGLFSFLKFRKTDKPPVSDLSQKEYIPFLWEDDYCQIEIVPSENKTFIQKQAGQIENLSAKSRTDHGFTDIFIRGSLPIPTITKEIRFDYLERTLESFQFQRAKYIQYDGKKVLDCETSNTKAFGFPRFTIFYDTEGEFVKNIWVNVGHSSSGLQLDLIQSALYTLGEECELLLIDWNSLELVNLADKVQIQSFLMLFWK